MALPTNIRSKRKAEFLEKMKSTLGNISASCRALGLNRKTFYDWMEKDKAFAEAVEEIYETNTDFVESKLMKLINEENPTAIIFYLKTKGKKRGYVETQEIVGSKESPVCVSFADALKGVDTEITDEDLKG